jgi:hypothetical protein
MSGPLPAAVQIILFLSKVEVLTTIFYGDTPRVISFSHNIS